MGNHHFQFLSLSKNDDGIVQEFCTENIACCLHSFIKKRKIHFKAQPCGLRVIV